MISQLIQEIRVRKKELNNQPVETIYFGGGTPSILSQKEIDSLINAVYANHKIIENPEITLEANPDDLNEEKIKQLAASKINRLSIGVQSFFEQDLKLMNRAHNAYEAKQCLSLATQYFNNISIDLIYGIPGLSDKQWIKNIQTALSFGIPHISSYALTVEPNTALEKFIKKGVIDQVDDTQAQNQFYLLVDLLEKENFIHYEVSNFGKKEAFSKNNSAYWKGKPFIGIGPSAHSYDGSQRSWNHRNNVNYIKALKNNELPIERETLSTIDKYNEYVMTRLRTIWGISFEEVAQKFGNMYVAYLNQQSEKFILDHLLYIDNGILRTTRKGKFLSDGIASDLFMLNLN